MTKTKAKAWAVWHSEYPDEGSLEVRARSHQAAKRKSELSEDVALLRARVITPKIRMVRKAMEVQ